MKAIAVIFVLLTATALAQHWEFERVDTAPWGAYVRSARALDGSLVLCYGDSSGTRMRVARRDSAWQYDELAASGRNGSLAISPLGTTGVAYRDSGLGLRLLEKHDSTWALSTIPSAPSYSVELGYDSAGAPQALHGDVLSGWWYVIRSRRPDSVWLDDTVATNERRHPGDYCWMNCYAVAGGRIEAGLYTFVRSFPADFPVLGVDLYRVDKAGGDWTRTMIAGGAECFTAGTALAAASGAFHSCYSISWPGDDRFYYDGEEIDNGWVPAAALRIDATGRPHIARAGDPGDVRYQFYNGVWRSFDVGATTVGPLALELDARGEPLIAFANDSGVWLARGVQIVGTAEPERPGAARVARWPTIARGSLLLAGSPSSSPSWLLDAAGRRVVELTPGENDISRLAPGVYFVPAVGNGRKVIVARY